jgi:hypothetical protein
MDIIENTTEQCNHENWYNTNEELLSTTDITAQFSNNILSNNMDNVVKTLILQNSTKFEKLIIDYIETHQAITWGQEWEVYKVNIEWKELILAKKRYDSNSKHEFNLQKTAYRISQESNSWIKVPEPIYEFSNWENWYVIMEYVEWKTLYTLSWEAIINQQLIPYLEKYILHEQNDFQYAEVELKSLINRYSDNNDTIVKFNDDTKAEDWVIEFIDILYKLRIIKENPNTITKDINNPHIRKNIALEEYYKKYIWSIAVFNDWEWNKIADQLHNFINDMHNKWLYHRDLWWNPRNIMFWDNGTYVIDFWKSESNVIKWWYSNIDQISWGIYDDDEWMVHRIRSLSSDIKTKEKLEDNSERNNWIRNKAEQIWLNITDKSIILLEQQVKSIDIHKYIDDLVNNKDRSYNWFIYLSEKWADSDWKKKSNNIWKNKLFTLLQLLSNNELESIIKKLEWLKENSKSKRSRWYKYAELILSYIN